MPVQCHGFYISMQEAYLDQDISIPLVLDLDGTLIATDSLHESLLQHLKNTPSDLVRLPLWVMAGRAQFKQRFAEVLTQEDIDALPATPGIIALAEREAAKGRKIVLATAANRAIAEKISARFPFISEVLASDDRGNLKGAAKAAALTSRYPDGFIYAGDSEADLHVWRSARAAVIVERGKRLRSKVQPDTPVVAHIHPSGQRANVLRRAARLHQWAKNALVFVPLVLGGQIFSAHAWGAAILAFMAMGLLASGTYIANDMWDLAEDRRHWSKKKRPLASGQLPLDDGLFLLMVCGLAALLFAAADGVGAIVTLAIYLVMSLAYSYKFKREPIVDVLLLAGMFTMRLVLGQVVTGVALAPWLLVFSMFIFLSLSLVKRHTEVMRMVQHGHQKVLGRGYLAVDAPLILALGVASSMGAVAIMVLYLIDEAFQASFYRHPALLWGFPMIIFLFLGRIWLLCQRQELQDDPVAFALKDRVSLFYGATAIALFLAAIVPV
ncbi:UbiA prenyltransferase family protein [Granulibacter bethesdensis]|nr:UbiA prenyltransferase family protein [Granulibacter bethesdensis]